MNLSLLPTDVLELVAAQVADRDGAVAEINDDLRACRLVSRSFAFIFQRHIFHRGYFADTVSSSQNDASIEQLLAIIETVPQVRIYARSFTLTLSPGRMAPPRLPSLLDQLQNLTSFAIYCHDLHWLEWRLFQSDFRNSIDAISKLPSLRHLSISGVFGFPASIILEPLHLSKLEISRLTIDHTMKIELDEVISRPPLHLTLCAMNAQMIER